MARYKMRQHLISIGEDFTIEDENGHPAYKVDGKALRLRETFVLEDMQGGEVATIRQKVLALRESMNILRHGKIIATIRKTFSLVGDRFVVDVKDGQDLAVQGNILENEYEIYRGHGQVARVSKRWFTVRDTYGIDIAPNEDEGLILAIAVAIDEMEHDPAPAQAADTSREA